MAKTSKKNTLGPQESALFEHPPETTAESTPPEQTVNESSEQDEPEPEPQQPVETPKPRNGRPPKGQEKNTTNQVIDRVSEISDWGNTKVYLYRDFPITNRRNGGNQYLNIETFQRPFDQGDVMKMHGSGTYGIRINKTDPATGKDKTIDQGKLHILNMEYPPKIPRGEWVDDPRNNEWKWVKEIWERQDHEKAKMAEVASPTAIFTPLIDIMKDQLSAYRMELQSLRESSNRKDPQEQTILAILLQKVMEKPAPPPPPPPDPVRDMMLTFMMRQLEKTSEPAAAVAPPKDTLDDLDRILSAKDKLESLGGGKGRGKAMEPWMEFTTEMGKALTPILAPFANVAAQIIMDARRAAQQQAQQAGQPQQPPPDQSAQPELQEIQAGAGPQLVRKTKPTDIQLAGAVLEHLNEKKTGYQLGDWYIEQFGREEFDELRMLGKDRILKELQGLPAWNSIAQYISTGELSTLMKELFLWEPPDEDDEEDEDAEPEDSDHPKPPPTADAITDGWTTQEARQ